MTLTATVSRTATHAGLLRPSRVTLRSPAPFRSIRGPGAVRMAKNSTLTVALSQDELKKQAAHKAVEYAKSGMVLGLGTGSTTAFAIDRIGELMKKGELKDIVGVPTSIKSYEQASGTCAFIQMLQQYLRHQPRKLFPCQRQVHDNIFHAAIVSHPCHCL